MLLTTPYVLGIDESPHRNQRRQLAVPVQAVEGTLVTFTRNRVTGWLFQPTVGDECVLIIPTKKRLDRVPDTYPRVLLATVDNAGAPNLDLSPTATWLRHPQLGIAASHKQVRDSWIGAFAFAKEDEDRGVVGLRPPQIGAIHAIHARWSVSAEPSTIVMPTGTGKTETMLSVLVSAGCSRVLVVVPTDALRTQISEKVLTLGVLKHPRASILAGTALHPTVCVLKHKPRTAAEVGELFEQAHVIVTTTSIAGQCEPEAQQAMAALCSHLFIDEAHHAEATTWKALRESFASRLVLQFTATPFREDGAALEGHLTYVYPLRKAQAENYFKPIRFVNVLEFDPNRSDEAIAAQAIAQLRADFDKGHILMARVDTIARADQVFELYERYPEFNPVKLHTQVPARAREQARQAVVSKRARIVVCVDMLGEGFDLPELKIAAFHDIRKSLAVTLQLAGRFTRSRPDLGDATFIANTADVTVRNELRKLYTRDPDWNLLLPEFSDTIIGAQQSLQDFLKGFSKLADEIPLNTIRPALSTVVYRTRCDDWAPDAVLRGIPNLGACEQVKVATNETAHTVVVVTARRVPLAWTDVEQLFSWAWELYVIFWWKEQHLLFINGSTNAGEFKTLAQSVAGQDVELIRGQQVFRAFAGINRLRLNNVGLTEQLGRNVSFTSRMGADVAAGLHDAQRRRASKSNLAGAGFEGGSSATIGASRKGRIWCHRRDRVDQLVAWCRHIGVKLLDQSIDPETVLRGTLETVIVTARPDGMPLFADWPREIYSDTEQAWSVQIADRTLHISQVELEVIDATLAGPIRFAVVADAARAEFELEYFLRGETWDYRFVRRGDEAVRIVHADAAAPAEEFFSENPPKIWFADGAMLEGDEYTPLKAVLPPYDRQRIATWDWTGIDITKESQGIAKEADSVQAAVIRRLMQEDYQVIFDDDDAGEAADVVAVRLVGDPAHPTQIDVEFYHCKFSLKARAGARVDDLYVVCGQAQTSIRWMSSAEKRTDLFTHLLRRDAERRASRQVSRFERGDPALVATIREMSITTHVTLKIHIVQPGVSRVRISETQLRLLSVTENYLQETYELPFGVITSA